MLYGYYVYPLKIYENPYPQDLNDTKFRELKSVINYWNVRGIQGPKGNFFFGSLLNVASGVYEFDSENFEKYGKTFGTTMKGVPDLVTMDMDLIQKILISEFENFSDPHSSPASKSKRDLRKLMLNVQTGDDWRRIRRKITPAMTSAKIKHLIPGMNYCIGELVKYIKPFAAKGTDIPLTE